MRKIGMLVTMMALLLLAACGQSESSSSDGKVFELNYNNLAPPTHPYTKNVAEPWAEFVEEETDGKVKVHVFPSSSLGTTETGYDDISGGVFDVGLLYASADQNEILFPLSIGDLPFAIPNPEVAVNVMNKFYDKFVKDQFQDVVWLSASSTDTAQLYTTDPVETIDDIKKRKVSNSLYSRNELISKWGAIPVTNTNSELYESVERGIVDDVIYNTTGAIGFSLNEVAPNMTKLDLGVSSNALFINGNVFNQLPEEIQTLFKEKLGPKHQELMAELYMTEMENSIKEFENRVKDKGGKVIIPSEAELTKFKEPAEKMWDDWVKEANKKGYPGDEMMEFFKQSLAEEGVKIPF
ncbi:TRAP transporter substrate-binding protein DctP [Mesobacillus maritimus]|uniref:TRAP transporter substrate-binding protein DctP n=1 Tax=Mesobacillus maritimus TaxID=1643336 RepID=UPI00203F35AC|nr:TRAP transporter substrate-binding protein DctP [Mesobacillus maritimus]MCM3587858.1 TRAP transporter substrate-binding protein DctP [Mesobacillus maritimus]MCM3671787.1 TRAP transporter substrate-binding protein DctP [Mesobacillus maritimus]